MAVTYAAHNLVPSVNSIAAAARRAYERRQVMHRAVHPEKRMVCSIGQLGTANDNPILFQRAGASVPATERAEVNHLLAVPEERVLPGATRQKARAYDLAPVVESGNAAEGWYAEAKAAEVAERAVLPQKDIGWWLARERIRDRTGVRNPRDLAATVHEPGKAVRTTKRAKIAHAAVFPQKCPRLRPPAEHREGVGNRVRGNANDLVPVV